MSYISRDHGIERAHKTMLDRPKLHKQQIYYKHQNQTHIEAQQNPKFT